MPKDIQNALKNFFKDKKGKLAIVQFPNVALAAWFILMVMSVLISNVGLKTSLSHLSQAFLFAWAYMEAWSGESSFRKVLGAVVMATLIWGYFR